MLQYAALEGGVCTKRAAVIDSTLHARSGAWGMHLVTAPRAAHPHFASPFVKASKYWGRVGGIMQGHYAEEGDMKAIDRTRLCLWT